MRLSQTTIDTRELPWEQLSDAVSRKLLNGNPEVGPHTLLLRSLPREANGVSLGHYHPAAEEFFCLEGDFTFDEGVWFRDGAYAMYPAYCVHGTDVHVRGGYLLYLRLSGPGQLFMVGTPDATQADDGSAGESRIDPSLRPAIMELAVTPAAKQAPGKHATDSAVMITALHRDANGAGSTLVTAAADSGLIEIESDRELELFAPSGTFAISGHAELKTHGYHCEVGQRPRILVQCRESGSLLIGHDGELRVQQRGS